MSDTVNGSEGPELPQQATEKEQPETKGEPEFPFVRNVIGSPGGATDLIYNFKNGQFAGMVSFRVVSAEALGPIGEDFLHFTRQLLVQIKEAQAKAEAQRASPKLSVVPADALRGMKRAT